MNRVKYFGSYDGPSYGSGGWEDSFDAFSSLKGAMEAMWRRQTNECDDVKTYKENPSGFYVYWFSGFARFPGTTRGDWMDLYYAIPDENREGAYIQGDWAYRIVVGSRGGIRVEKA